jgi:hypothetical protein
MSGITSEQAREYAGRWVADVGGPIIGRALTDEERESLFAWVRERVGGQPDYATSLDLGRALGLTTEQADELRNAAGWPS